MKEGELYRSKYKILKVYKETLEGCVLLAEHVQLNSYWIIKKLNKVNPETLREVEVLKGVKNKGIPMIFDVISDDNSLVIIREFVEGENLNDYSKNGLSQDEVVSIGLKICEILRFLHEDLSTPLIFRDIKPGNIIMTKDGELKLIDFGIARFYKEDSNHDTEYLGTKGYAAPEQYGILQSDIRTDVFGLGATLYFLITKEDLGKPPYKLLPISKFRNDIDQSFEVILNKACEINKNKRYQDIKEFEKALTKLTKEENHLTWQEKLINTNVETVMFSGLKPGVGVTYTAMRLAKYLVNNNIKPLIIDRSENQSVLSLEFQEDAICEKDYIEYKEIRILALSQLDKYSNSKLHHIFKDVQLIIIDSGCYETSNYLNVNEKFDDYDKLKSFLISRVSPWEIDLFEEFVLSDDDIGGTNIIVNGCSKERYEHLNNSLDEIDLIYQDYKPYESLTCDDEFCESLLKEMEVFNHWPKKQSFLSPKFYKTKLLNRVKS